MDVLGRLPQHTASDFEYCCAKHQLRVLIDDCTDEEAAALLTTSETILKVLREKRPLSVKEKSLSPLE